MESRQVMAGDLVISEFMASNSAALVDEDGDYSDWIELYNRGDTDVSLAGWYLTDSRTNLEKWAFPAQTLATGSLLLVRASGKDRATVGHELHTNFQLDGDGEYLALTRKDPLPTDPNHVLVVTEYDIAFPSRFQDISYGLGQSVQVTPIVRPTNSARLLIPTNDSLGKSWIEPTFVDSSWQLATNAIGYETAVPGFTVLDAKSTGQITNLAGSDSLLSGVGRASSKTAIVPYVNFYEQGGGGGTGNFGGLQNFPNDAPGDDDDFAIRATGTILVPSAGIWTFGTNSDDGVRVRIDGQNVINDDTLHGPDNRFGQANLTAGPHTVELVFFERGGGAEVELFAAKGSFTTFNATAFKLVGDTLNGGLAVTTTPGGGPSGSGFGSIIQTNVLSTMANVSPSAYVRVPFIPVNVASLTSLTLRMRYDDGFVAYLNGVEVARRNAPASTTNASAALSDRPNGDALRVEDINIASQLSLLKEGQLNVLAIHALNDTVSSNEFLSIAELANVAVSATKPVYFTTPTPGVLNSATGIDGFLIDEITFSQPHGFYEASFPLTITAQTAGTTIRYTLDGTEPTATNGTVYTAPLTVSKTTTVRARAFKEGLDPSNVESATYLFLSDVIRQSPTGAAPAGFPTSTSINGQSLDYGMDPDIVNSPTWGPQLIDALKAIPTFSITMNINDLLSASTGIYTHAQNHGSEWERPVSLELIQPNGDDGFQINAGLRIRGGYSRSSANPKHALRLFFRNEYGDGKLNFPLFEEEGTDEFDSFDLRTSQNYSWSFDGSGQNAFIRDIFSRDIQGLMGSPYTRGRYYHVYINGQYWGLYESDERPEADYAASYFGGSSDDYDVVKSAGSNGGYQNEATDGTLESYQRLANYFYQAGGLGDANQVAYMRAQGYNPDGTRNPAYERLLDVDNLIDYMIITYYTSDADGPGSKFTRPAINNYFGIFNRKNPDGFKFFEHDSEHSLDTGNAAGANYNMVTPLTTGGSQFQYFNPHWMHEQLANSNTEYRQRFADRVYKYLFNDGVLTASRAKAVVDARAAQIDKAIIAESARWGDAKVATPFTKTNWLAAIASVKSFIDGRIPVLLDQLRSQNWYPVDGPPRLTLNGTATNGGTAAKGSLLAMAPTSTAANYSDIVAAGSVWKYLDNGSNQGVAWRDLNFNDATWKSGKGQLGYGDGDEQTLVEYGPDANNKYVTTYFRRTFTVADPGLYQSFRVRVLRDDGAVVFLNGEPIARTNMPGGDILFNTPATGTVPGSEESVYFDFDVDPSLLRAGNNVLAIEVHQAAGAGGNVTSSDMSFDAVFQGAIAAQNNAKMYYTLDGSDPRLAGGGIRPTAVAYNGTPLTLNGTTTLRVRTWNAGRWSPLLGTEFYVDTPASAASLAITEINYNPHDPLTAFGEAAVDNDLFEFLELQNISNQTIDLHGVRFVTAPHGTNTEGIEFPFATQTMAAGERIVVVRDRAAFASRYGNQMRIAERFGTSLGTGVFEGALDNTGEQLTLLDVQGQVIRQFTYDDGGSWPARADGGASSLELRDVAAEASVAGNWRNSQEFGGSPGIAGLGLTRDIVINELLTHTDLPLLDSIELHNTTNQPISIGNWYISDSSVNYMKYQIKPATQVIQPNGYVIIDETVLGFGFRGEASDDAWLIAANAIGKPARFVDHVEFDATQNGVTLGRWPNASGGLFPMTSRTLGSTNSGPLLSDVVISEVQYHPVAAANGPLTEAELEYVEVWNRGASAHDISFWQLKDAVHFDFPLGTILNADEHLAIVSFDPIADPAKAAAFRAAYHVSATARLVGPWSGLLDGSGETLGLARPEDLSFLGVGYILVDRIPYDDQAPWPTAADGQGASLHRTTPVEFGDFAGSWSADLPTPGETAIGPIVGDWNNDQLVDGTDIGLLCSAIASPNPELRFDLTHDGQVDRNDYQFLINDVLQTSAGDANLDRQFDSGDLIVVFQAGEYEDATNGNSGWSEGDWNCDGDFDTADLIEAFQAGRYIVAASPVAPPSSIDDEIAFAAVARTTSLPTGSDSKPSLLSEPSLLHNDSQSQVVETSIIEYLFATMVYDPNEQINAWDNEHPTTAAQSTPTEATEDAP